MSETGKAWVYGDDVDTDVIIPARYLNTSDPRELAAHCMEDIDKTFALQVKSGDVIVAGRNFGCGSSREHAPIALKASGISAIVAVSFARIFYRNALNIGLAIWECPEIEGQVNKGDRIKIDFAAGKIILIDRGLEFQSRPFPPFIEQLIKDGGLVNYVRNKIKERKI